jgi:caa(3)-type oxidase subunit IV
MKRAMDGARTADPEARSPLTSQHIMVFLVLVTVTTLEVSVSQLAFARAVRITALAGLVIAKVAAVMLFFMRLRSESRALRLTAAVPLVLAPAFAVVLMLDAIYRVVGPR